MAESDKVGIIESAPGKRSSTRVMSLLVAATGCAVYAWSAYSGTPIPDIPASWLPIAAAALGMPSLNTLAEGKLAELMARATGK